MKPVRRSLDPLTYAEAVALVRRVEAKLNESNDDTVTITAQDAEDLCERVRTLLQMQDAERRFPARF